MPGSSNAKIGPARLTKIDQLVVPNGVGAVAALTSSKAHSHALLAICPAGQTIYLGRTADIASVTTTVKTWPMTDGSFLVVENCDLAEYCFFGSAAGAYLAVIDTSFY